MLSDLTANAASIDALQSTIASLDACFLNGFVGGQHDILPTLAEIFSGTPMEQRVCDSVEALMQNMFVESHFVTLAAIRSALQGTLYDLLRRHALAALERNPSPSTPEVKPVMQTDPLLDSVRHWLMELAMRGFARLESGAVTSFAPTLAQLRANRATAQTASLLTGFVQELLASLPITNSDSVPLLRWCDLWSKAMLGSLENFDAVLPTLVSGVLYPLGVELRQHTRMASLVAHGVLVVDDKPQFMHQTWSAFKSTAIQGDEIWLLFPDAQFWLQQILQGKAMILRDMPLLPSGDLVWQSDAAESGKKFKLLELANHTCGIGQQIAVAPVHPLERHPIQLAEPVTLTEYQLENDVLHLKDGSSLRLDTRRKGLPPESIAATTALFGLLRYDDDHWSVQVLTAGNPIGKFEFVGQAGAELLKKPPKTNTVTILQERASRLLRAKS